MAATHDFPPRLMPLAAAARYIGVSTSTLRKLDIPRKLVIEKPVYDKSDLDAYADGIPYEGDKKKMTVDPTAPPVWPSSKT